MKKLVKMPKEQFIKDIVQNEVIQNNNADLLDLLVNDLDEPKNINDLMIGIIPETFAKDYKKLKKLQEKIEKTEKEIKEKLIELFENNPEMQDKSVSMDGLKFTYTKPYDRISVDSKKLQEEYPEVYKKVTKKSKVKSTIKTYVEF